MIRIQSDLCSGYPEQLCQTLYKVKIKITGNFNETEPIVLDNSWHDDFERGKTDSFEIKAIDLGEERGLSGSFSGSICQGQIETEIEITLKEID